MQIQMLLVAALDDPDEQVYCAWLNGPDGNGDEAPVGMALVACHLTDGLKRYQPG